MFGWQKDESRRWRELAKAWKWSAEQEYQRAELAKQDERDAVSEAEGLRDQVQSLQGVVAELRAEQCASASLAISEVRVARAVSNMKSALDALQGGWDGSSERTERSGRPS